MILFKTELTLHYLEDKKLQLQGHVQILACNPERSHTRLLSTSSRLHGDHFVAVVADFGWIHFHFHSNFLH